MISTGNTGFNALTIKKEISLFATFTSVIILIPTQHTFVIACLKQLKMNKLRFT